MGGMEDEMGARKSNLRYVNLCTCTLVLILRSAMAGRTNLSVGTRLVGQSELTQGYPI